MTAKSAPLPLAVTIGPHSYEIRADAETARLVREDHCNGDSMPDHHLVRLDTDRPHTAVAETLLHELLHCLLAKTALTRSDVSDQLEENIVKGLSPWLLGMLRGNPALVAYLTADAAP